MPSAVRVDADRPFADVLDPDFEELALVVLL